MKKRFASGAEKRAMRRRFKEASAQQRGALFSFIQKREDVSSGNEKTVEEKEDVETDTDIIDDTDTDSNLELLTKPEIVITPSISSQVFPEHEPDPAAADVAGHDDVIQQPEPRSVSVSHAIADDPALWKVGDHATVEYRIRAGPSTCRHRDGVYEKSVRKPEKGSVRQLRDASFSTVSPNGETADRIWLCIRLQLGRDSVSFASSSHVTRLNLNWLTMVLTLGLISTDSVNMKDHPIIGKLCSLTYPDEIQ